jgi:MFS family permease
MKRIKQLWSPIRKGNERIDSPSLLNSNHSSAFRQRYIQRQNYSDNDNEDEDLISFSDVGTIRTIKKDKYMDETDDFAAPQDGSLSHFFFGFLYDSDDNIDEAEDNDDEGILDEILVDSDVSYSSPASNNQWTRHLNSLNLSLFAALFLTSLASVVPVTLVPVLATLSQFSDSSAETSFAPQAASAAVLGTAFGKILNGPVGDLVGARRTTLIYNILLILALLGLGCAQSPSQALTACFLVEFTSSVQWPCCIIILATHYMRHGKPKHNRDTSSSSNSNYEGAIYVTSLASRLGSLIGIPASSVLLRSYNLHWRMLALMGAWMAAVSTSVVYLYIQDSPLAQHDPQNPVNPEQLAKWFPDYYNSRIQQQAHSDQNNNHKLPPPMSASLAMGLVWFIIRSNVVPSVKRLLQSGTFWSVALAHTGSSVIRSSERILGTYLADTSNGTLAEARAAGMAVCLSVGTFVGLVVAGSMFARRTERQRKWLVSKLYFVTIVACYVLAFLAIPAVRRIVNEPGMITVFQTLAVVAAGFGIAVQFYHIPSLVGATFGRDKGLFSAYTDGFAYGVASILWRIVGHVVSHGNPEGGGWAYGWAAVALLLIPSSLLMVEFMEHFFCRPRHKGSYETIIFA